MSMAVVDRAPNFVASTLLLARREIRNVLRAPSAYIPALVMPLFFYFVQSAALGGVFSPTGLDNYEAFVLPLSLMFAMSNDSAGLNMVVDVERGYFDKMLLAPISRVSIVLGAMGASYVRVVVQGLIVCGVALATGLTFATGIPGVFGLVLLSSLWGIAYAGFGIAVALKTGNSQATQSSLFFVFPLMFLTTAFAPFEALDGWLQTAARYNPLTYLLQGMRAFSLTGWDAGHILGALAAIGGVAALSLTLSFRALAGRLK
jgi:ABC-2 type transport system permease protein